MPTAAPPSPTLLVPTGDARPVEKAAVDGIADSFDPETFLWITFHRPDGGARVWYAWTAGGTDLGDHLDRQALAAGLDFADWLHIGDRHCQHSTRGRIAVQASTMEIVCCSQFRTSLAGGVPRRSLGRRGTERVPDDWQDSGSHLRAGSQHAAPWPIPR